MFLTLVTPDDDDGTFALDVANAVAKHASKSREQWALELVDAEDGLDPVEPKVQEESPKANEESSPAPTAQDGLPKAHEESPNKQKTRNKFLSLRRFF